MYGCSRVRSMSAGLPATMASLLPESLAAPLCSRQRRQGDERGGRIKSAVRQETWAFLRVLPLQDVPCSSLRCQGLAPYCPSSILASRPCDGTLLAPPAGMECRKH
jgi:hypothetical protein